MSDKGDSNNSNNEPATASQSSQNSVPSQMLNRVSQAEEDKVNHKKISENAFEKAIVNIEKIFHQQTGNRFVNEESNNHKPLFGFWGSSQKETLDIINTAQQAILDIGHHIEYCDLHVETKIELVTRLKQSIITQTQPIPNLRGASATYTKLLKLEKTIRADSRLKLIHDTVKDLEFPDKYMFSQDKKEKMLKTCEDSGSHPVSCKFCNH